MIRRLWERHGERFRPILPVVLGIAALVALVLAVNPRLLGQAIARFQPRFAPALVALSLSYYMLQALRWRILLRAEGVDLSVRDALVLNLAGQSTSLLPLGELTRALFVAEATGASLGTVTATVTVQELIYSLILIAVAVPGAVHILPALVGVGMALVGTVAVFVILTVPAVFERVRHGVCRVPLLRRFVPAIEQLQRDSQDLLRHRVTYTTAWISLLQTGIAVTLFWLAAHSLGAGVGWVQVAFVYAVIHVASAMTMSPGGMGAFEVGAAGLLVAVGLPFGLATAVAIVHRAADKGVGTMAGMAAYLWSRRHWSFGDVSLMSMRQDEHGHAADEGGATTPARRDAARAG